MDESAPSTGRARTSALLVCAGLPLVFGVVSLLAARTKCATIDEPLHAVGAYLHVFHRDWRINPEDPPLWNYLAMAGHNRSSLVVDFDDPEWSRTLNTIDLQTRITTRTLYQSPVNDGARFVNRSRAMMNLAGIGLGMLIALFAWKLAGPAAGVVAVTLYSFDPNFLAHAPLVKNDVTISLLFLAASIALWSVGKRLAWWNVLLLGALCGAAAGTKFSGLLLAPIVAMGLLIRALLGQPWPVLRGELGSVAARSAAALAVGVICALLGVLVVWASYGFRFAPTKSPPARLDLALQVQAAKQNRFFHEHGRFASADELAARPVPLTVRIALAVERARLLPHAYVYGFVFTYQTSLVRMAYLFGDVSLTGWWYYFPLAMLFKTPLAVIAAMLVAIGVCVGRLKRPLGTSTVYNPLDRWSLVCLLTAPTVYLMVAMSSSLNLGLRHVLPVYPSIYILVGVIGAAMWARQRWTAIALAAVLGLGLVGETARSFPHYISFFNTAARPHALKLLSDSNLDWGQDLPLLAEWRRRNPQVRLYLSYFGSVDPAFYGISDYINLPPGFWLGPPHEWPSAPGVIAVSATYLQGNHMNPELQANYAALREQTPRRILGGSIYLYDYGPPRPWRD